MSAIIAMLVAAVPNVFLAVASKLVTEKFLQAVLEKVLVYGLEKVAKISTNSIDDEVVADIKRRLTE